MHTTLITHPTRRYTIVGLVLLGISLLPALVAAESGRAVGVVPDEERRSVIQAADGHAHLGEDQTISQMREMAFTNAKRRVLEQATTRITSETKMKNFQLEYDVVMSKAAGDVTILEEKDHSIQGNRYHVWIKAEVAYSLHPKGGESSPSVLMHAAAPLTVKVWRAHLRKGGHLEKA